MKKFKSEDGYTGIDITVAILVITIFVSLIGTLMYLVDQNTKESQRNTDAMHYAIAEIESIKEQARKQGLDSLSDSYDGYIKDVEGRTTPYFKDVAILDFKHMGDNATDGTIESNIVKKVIVKVSYRSKGKAKSIELSTIVAKEN